MTIEVAVLQNANAITAAINELTDKIDGGSISPATADTLGGVKIGEGISVTSDGTISASGGGGGLSYDTVIDISHGGFIDWMTSVDEYNATVTGLTVAEAKQKMEAGEDVRICITSHCTNYGHPAYMEMPVTAAWIYYNDGTFEWIELHVVAIDTYTGEMSHHCIKWPAGSTTSFIVADDFASTIEYQA